MTPQKKSPIEIVKGALDALPKPNVLQEVSFTGGRAGEQFPPLLFSNYKAAYKVIQALVKNGITEVDGSAIIIIRDALTAACTIEEMKNNSSPSVKPDYRAMDLRVNLEKVFDALEYFPPARSRIPAK